MSGSSTLWGNWGLLSLGVSSAGGLSITEGARVVTTDLLVGDGNNSSGGLSISGSGSFLSSDSGMNIGDNGDGTLSIEDGGRAQSSYAFLGYMDNVTGTGRVTGANSTWHIADYFFIGDRGIGLLTIENGARVSNRSAHVGKSLGSSGTVTLSGATSQWTNSLVYLGDQGTGIINLGAAEGDAAAEAGNLDADIVYFGYGGGDGTLVFNHTGQAYQFESDMHGAGAIRHLAGNTILTGDSSALNANTTLLGGRLSVNGVLGGVVDVLGGTLGGSGSLLGNVSLAANSTLAPGNSIGTLSIGGSVDFMDGSTLAVEVDAAGNADKLNVGGTVTIASGANLTINAGSGAYSASTDYTLITAAHGIAGSFDVISDLYFLTPTLTTIGNDLVLTLVTTARSPSDLAQTPNQAAVAGAVAAQGFGSPLYDSFLPLSADQARTLLDDAAGQDHIVGQNVIDNTFALFSDAMRNRQGSPTPTQSSSPVAPLGYAAAPAPTGAGAAIAMATTDSIARQDFWLAPMAGVGRIDARADAPALDWLSAGLAVGTEYHGSLGNAQVQAGAALGYVHGDAENGRSTIASNTGQIGLYGTWQEGPAWLSGSMAYGLGLAEMRRTIAAGATSLVATSDAWNHELSAASEFAYALELSPGLKVAPVARLEAAFSHRAASTETGAGIFDLSVDASTRSQLAPALGVEFEYAMLTEAGALTARARASWQHAVFDAGLQNMRFVGTNAAFAVTAPQASRDTFELDLGLALQTGSNLTLSADYAGRLQAIIGPMGCAWAHPANSNARDQTVAIP